MKKCNKCGEEKDLSAFLPDPRYKGGHRHTCKVCYRQNNRRWSAANKEHRRRKSAEHYRNNKHLYARPPLTAKLQARGAVSYAIKKGELAPASACECNDCGLPAKDLHHHSYEREHWLDVVPLCRSCHLLRHAQSERSI